VQFIDEVFLGAPGNTQHVGVSVHVNSLVKRATAGVRPSVDSSIQLTGAEAPCIV